MIEDRYQYQPWYIKLWRRRLYFKIPFSAVAMWMRSKESFGLCWRLATSLVQVDMKWHYSWSEIKKKFELDNE